MNCPRCGHRNGRISTAQPCAVCGETEHPAGIASLLDAIRHAHQWLLEVGNEVQGETHEQPL